MGNIKINGKNFETFIDKEGVERFKPNNLISKLHVYYSLKISDIIKLAELEAITINDLLDYYAGIGFTVSGVKELSFFEDFEFKR